MAGKILPVCGNGQSVDEKCALGGGIRAEIPVVDPAGHGVEVRRRSLIAPGGGQGQGNGVRDGFLVDIGGHGARFKIYRHGDVLIGFGQDGDGVGLTVCILEGDGTVCRGVEKGADRGGGVNAHPYR